MKTLTTEQVFQHMADNMRTGKSPVDRLQAMSEKIAWTDVPDDIYVRKLASGYFEFRIAQRTHNLNGYDVPAPMDEAPEVGTKYWYLDNFESDGVCWTTGDDTPEDHNALRNGLWLSEEDAIANAKALRGEDPYKEAE